MLESALKTAAEPDNVEVLLYVDNDDGMLEDGYRPWIENWFTDQMTAIIGPRIGVGKSWNRLLKTARGDLIMMGNDDQVFETNGWDLTLDLTADEYPDDIFCLWFDDSLQHERHCAFPIVSKKWCDTLGFFTPECFDFFCHDTYIWDIAKRIDRCQYIPTVVVRHEHFSKGYPLDATYRLNREKTNKDLQILEDTADQREEFAAQLRKVMTCPS